MLKPGTRINIRGRTFEVEVNPYRLLGIRPPDPISACQFCCLDNDILCKDVHAIYVSCISLIGVDKYFKEVTDVETGREVDAE